MKLSEIKNSDKKIAIHCQTEAEANAYCKIMHDAGEKWVSGNSYLLDDNNFSVYSKDTCYAPEDNTYADVETYKDELDYTIIPAIDFIRANETHEDSLKRQGLKVGDKVKVLCKAESRERGWNCSWAIGMNGYILSISTITNIDKFGIELNKNYSFPAFVLEKVEEEKKEEQPTKTETMQKETLVAFDYEKAKAKPELIRSNIGETPTCIMFTNNGLVCEWKYTEILYNKYGTGAAISGDSLLLVDDEPVTTWFNNVYKGSIGVSSNTTLEMAISKRNGRETAVQKTTIKGKKVDIEIVHYY